ncbi:hypothetical protein B296_00048498 [Ensete ventricosum]|uniref:Uncharacterized protein n=1 Tax=Ensete ventricosum TaxID=4639 RepID=A0A426XBL8_ENSVE|nr:hypothetical protein B296_00048498 [Ensete ventricosum]
MSSVCLGHIPRDDKGRAGCTNKLPSHRYKTPISTTGRGELSHSLSLYLSLSRTLNFTLSGGQFRILPNLGIEWASLGHPSHSRRGLSAGSSSPRQPEGQTARRSGRGPPRERQSMHEVSIPIDVGRLAHSDENKSSRHLSLTPKSFVTFLAQEGGLMSQECPMSNPNMEHPDGSTHVFPSTLQAVGQAPRILAEEASTMLPTPNRYWRLFNDPGLAPPDAGLYPITSGLGPPRNNRGVSQSHPTSPNADWDDPSYCPLHPSTSPSADAPASAYPSTDIAVGSTPVKAIPRRTPRQSTPPLDRSHDREPECLGESTGEPLLRCYASPARVRYVSSDSTNSVREQLRQVNQRLDEVQRDFVRSKEEVGETTKGGSPFTPEILDKPIPSSFRLPTLKPYDGSTDPTEHVAAFRLKWLSTTPPTC